MATIREVARRAGVSVGTVSNVLSGAVAVSSLLKERVLAAVRKLDYQPNPIARSLRIRQTCMLGMVVSDITNPFFPPMVRGAEDAAIERGYLLVTFNSDDQIERERYVLGVLRARRVDGVLLVPAPNRGDYSHLELTAAALPIVCLDRMPAKISFDAITADNVGGARGCMRHLVAAGHRRIGLITASTMLATARERLRGYKLALKDAGIESDPELIREGDFGSDSGYRMGVELLALTHRPSAIFIANGLMALGVLRALDDARLRCPQDVALATFDDVPFIGALHPQLTAVSQPAYEMGARGARRLIDRIEGRVKDKEPCLVRLATELKVRESSSATVAVGA